MASNEWERENIQAENTAYGDLFLRENIPSDENIEDSRALWYLDVTIDNSRGTGEPVTSLNTIV